MITNPTPKFKTHFFLDLAKSGRSGQYLAGTGPEPDLKKLTGSTGTGTGFPVAHCLLLFYISLSILLSRSETRSLAIAGQQSPLQSIKGVNILCMYNFEIKYL